MFENLKEQPADKILAMMDAFRADPRPGKIDLGVGVYKNAQGHTPVMRAVKAAEKLIWDAQDTKVYTGLAGDPAFANAIVGLVLGSAVERAQVAAVGTPGGTGAVRQACELIQAANPQARIFYSDPTWPNHVSIFDHLKIESHSYRYFDSESGSVDFDGMIADLRDKLRPGDVVLLHGCCHNPTGANLTLEQWKQVADLLNEKAAVPLIDIAYQGFGDGLEADAAGTRYMASHVPETIIASSCSKNFGLYRERTGLLMAVNADASKTKVTQGMLAALNRQNYSFPPDHGARVVTTILTSPELHADWMSELEEVRSSMLNLRQQLAAELQRLSGSDRFAFLGVHRGMFSRLGASPEQVEKMRVESGIYMVGDSRMNVAGLNEASVPILARAIIDAGV